MDKTRDIGAFQFDNMQRPIRPQNWNVKDITRGA